MRQSYLLAAALILCSCATDEKKLNADDTTALHLPSKNNPDTQMTDSLAGRWKLIPALPADTATGRIPWLTFDMANMKLSGNTGCNNFSVSFAKRDNNLSIDSNLVSTKMACPGLDENAFVNNLMRANNYEIHGDTLLLKQDVTPLSYWLKSRL